VEGPVVACVYEVAWGTPDKDRDHAPGFVDWIAPDTEAAVRRADRIVTCSQSSKSEIIDTYGIARSQVHVVPFGVDVTLFKPRGVAPGRDLLLKRTGNPHPYVLYAASLHPRKNLSAVRDAVSGLARRGFPHVLVIVGGDIDKRSDANELEKQAYADLPDFPDRVVRIDNPSDYELSVLMAGADAFCLPSKYEGFGLSALEAMASGAPVVVSNRGSLPEVVGRAGWIVEPNPTAIEDALVDIITNPAKARRMRMRARRRASRYSWERTANGWLRVAEQAASEFGRPSL
jgi:alpha-1,3-rhamnosyl/mannosyltransferase